MHTCAYTGLHRVFEWRSSSGWRVRSATLWGPFGKIYKPSISQSYRDLIAKIILRKYIGPWPVVSTPALEHSRDYGETVFLDKFLLRVIPLRTASLFPLFFPPKMDITRR